jgi:hypothetical protein
MVYLGMLRLAVVWYLLLEYLMLLCVHWKEGTPTGGHMSLLPGVRAHALQCVLPTACSNIAGRSWVDEDREHHD